MRRPFIALVLLASLAGGCPQERPEAARQIPRERIPPAVSLEPPAADGGGQPSPPAPAEVPAVGAPDAGARPGLR